MKSFVISLLLLNLSISSFSQSLKTQLAKPAIDTSVLGKWPSAGMPTISGDGNFAFYTIRNQPADGSTLVIRSLKDGWKKEIINASNASFTSDCHKIFFISPRRTLCSLDLGSDSVESVAGASSYRLVKENADEWLVYQLSNAAKELKAVNLRSNVEKSFPGVINYLFGADGNVLVLLKQSGAENKSQTIEWINFLSGDTRNIWNGNGASGFILDKPGSQLAFVVETKEIGRSIFYYKAGSEKAELLADNNTKGIDSSLVINGIADGFSKDGEKVFINLKEKERPKPKPGAVMVDVWSYQDVKLQSMQLAELSSTPSYKAVIRINDHEVVRLQQDGDKNISVPKQWPNKVYVFHYKGDLLESHWNVDSQLSCYLVSTDNGERQELKIGSVPILSLSPSGKYIIRKLAEDKENFYCYNTLTGKSLNISHSISASFDKLLDDKASSGKAKWLEVGPWLENEKSVILFDRYDMWLVDPDGIKSPVNLTNAYGQKNKIVFRLPEVYGNKFISADERIIIKGFNRINKQEGLYMIQPGKQGGPQILTKGPYQYEIPANGFNSAQVGSNTQRFLIRRESATQSPNYFLTSDFKGFTPVTDIYPERAYNWLISELHTWKSLNGETLQGILYKPENFDPKKKYPVIFHYYQTVSDKLNKYLEPDAITDHLNIPWFVSNGYLVFTPDIHYQMGKTGESAFNAVVSAAHYLSKIPFVHSKRMGLQGQSFGGYETNYIVTHSNLFAAAMSSSGFSDFISDYNSLSHGGMVNQSNYEDGQNRIGIMLWERPDLYIQNSPIFNAYKVSTPILLMSNNGDRAVPFSQGLEFFLALRRLGKIAWMLQYDYGDHVLFKKEDALQHTIRITQFFDHYLKHAPAPVWMTKGIPASRKGIDDGLELDKEIKTPGDGLLKPEEKKKIEELRERKPTMITLD
jgi:dipeptidyl aminopeptidase/acylaminoacyl peptidase